MSEPALITDARIEEMLGLAAEMDLEYAQHVHALGLASSEPAVVSDLGRTRARTLRSMRQSLALLAKLRGETARLEREVAHRARIKEILHPNGTEPPPPRRLFPRDIPAANARADDIRGGVQRLIWSEGFEHSDYDDERELEGHFFRCLEDFLAEDRLKDDFTTRDLDDQIAELATAFGLNASNIPRWRDLPDPDPDTVEAFLADDSDDGEHPKWRSSG